MESPIKRFPFIDIITPIKRFPLIDIITHDEDLLSEILSCSSSSKQDHDYNQTDQTSENITQLIVLLFNRTTLTWMYKSL